MAKSRLKACEGCSGGVADAAMNPRGDLLAYAVAYDWSLGPRPAPCADNGLFLRVSEDASITPKAK